jgi:Tfp pilus assembly protein PilF
LADQQRRSARAIVRDALLDVVEPALQEYVESRLRSHFGSDWEVQGLKQLEKKISRFREMRRRAFAEREASDLDLMSLSAYRDLLTHSALKEAFADWPYDVEETTAMINMVLAPVRDSASHGTTQLDALNAEVALLTGEKILRLIDAERATQMRGLLGELRGHTIATAAGEPLHNVEFLDEPAMIGRQPELARLTAMLTRPTARVVSVTGRGGIGKTSLVKHFVADTVRFREPAFDVVVYLSAKIRELQTDAEVSEIAPDMYTASDIYRAILRTAGEATASEAPEDLARAAYRVLAEEKLQCLVVIDNLETVLSDDVLAFIDTFPAHSGSRLVFTSRDNLGRGAQNDIRLEGLPLEQAITLARRRAQELGLEERFRARSDVVDFVESVYRNPLAIITLISRLEALSVRELAARVRSYTDQQLQQYSWDTSLARLEDSDRRLVLAYALIQRPCGKDDVCAVADISEEEFVAGLSRLRRFHLLGVLKVIGSEQGYSVDPDAGGYVLRLFPKERAEMYQAVRSRFLEYQREASTHLRALRMREVRLQEARAYLKRSDYPNATTRIGEVIRIAPAEPLGYGLLALVDIAAGHTDEARSNFRKFEELGGQDSEIFQRWGHMEYKLGNFEIAVEKLTRATELRPDDPVFRHYQGVALWRFGLRHLPQLQVERARDLFQQAEAAFAEGYFESLDREFEYSHNERNHCARISNLINLRDFRVAREVLSLATKEHPESAELRELSGRLAAEEEHYRTSGRAQRAAQFERRSRTDEVMRKPPKST